MRTILALSIFAVSFAGAYAAPPNPPAGFIPTTNIELHVTNVECLSGDRVIAVNPGVTMFVGQVNPFTDGLTAMMLHTPEDKLIIEHKIDKNSGRGTNGQTACAEGEVLRITLQRK